MLKTNISNGVEKKSTIYLGADHAGFRLKTAIKKHLEEQGLDYKDLGDNKLIADDDYPDYAKKVAKAVATHKDHFGILVCGSGHGMSIAANRHKKIRAILGFSAEAAIVARHDSDSNVLCLAGRFLNTDHALNIVDHFLKTPFSGEERHTRRIKKLS